MIKKFIFIQMTLFILLISMVQVSKAVTYEGKFEDELSSGEIAITKYIGSDNQVAIPEKVLGIFRRSNTFVGISYKKAQLKLLPI